MKIFNDIPKNSIQLNESFRQKIDIYSNYVKDFMLDEQKLLFVEGIEGEKVLNFFATTGLVTLQWKEELEKSLPYNINCSLDVRYLSKLLAYCKKDIILVDLDGTKPSLWLYNNYVELLSSNITRESVNLELIPALKKPIRFPDITPLLTTLKKYKLTTGILYFDNFYYKLHRNNIITTFNNAMKLPFSSISLDTLTIASTFFGSETLCSNEDFTIIETSNGSLSVYAIDIADVSKPFDSAISPMYTLEVENFKQLLKIIKLRYNNLTISLTVHDDVLELKGIKGEDTLVFYTLPIQSLLKEKSKGTITHFIASDLLIDILKEYTGTINLVSKEGILQLDDNFYTTYIKS